MTKEIYLSETEYKALETQITNHAMDVRDKLIKEQGESIKELASALRGWIESYESQYGESEYSAEQLALANKYLTSTPAIKNED